jgi:drug/metabolite transporter (DMT)-like permease
MTRDSAASARLLPGRVISLAGVGFVLLSAAGFSWQGLFAKFAYRAGAGPISVGLGRFIVAGFILWTYVLVRHARGNFPIRLPMRSAVALLALGAVSYFLGSLTYLGAVVYIPASLAGLLLYTYPAITAFLAVWLGRERLTHRLTFGLGITLLGAAVTLGAPALAAAGHSDWRGIILVLSSCFFYSTYILGSERVLPGIHAILALAYISVGAIGSFVVLAAATGNLTPISPTGWLWIGAIALVSTIVAAGCFLAGLRRLGPARAATLSTVEPLFTVVFAAITLGERLTPLELLGGLIILAGVLLVVQERGISEPVA